jgi:hypothetical protein
MNTFYIWRVFISSWWSGWSSKFFGLLIHQRRGGRAVWAVEAFVFSLLLLIVLRKQLLCAFLSLIFLCGMMPFPVVGVLRMLPYMYHLKAGLSEFFLSAH